MRIMILEADPKEQILISGMLDSYEVLYETTIAKAINSIGIEHIDFAFVDADFKSKAYNWNELTSFLKSLKIDYSVFSSNGKVGIKNGQTIISINDISKEVEKCVFN